uniref:Uncharacterized protein n=1 Tax=Arion vulgaris TaxID=1028688 RepID=A0A0B7BJL9_9EUPU
MRKLTLLIKIQQKVGINTVSIAGILPPNVQKRSSSHTLLQNRTPPNETAPAHQIQDKTALDTVIDQHQLLD